MTVPSGWFWRWRDAIQYTRCLFWNSIFVTAIVAPFAGPTSFKALFYPKSSYPFGYKLGADWKLYPENRITTFVGRLNSLYANVARSRRSFEAKPDTGILGKSVTRMLNVVWNYVFKGFVGTLALIATMPIINVTISTGK